MLASSYGSTDSSVFSSRKASRATTRPPNGTFLTECSFAVSYDILLRALTDQYGYEPDWHALAFVDLADRNLESLVRLKEFLPALMEARLCVFSLALYLKMLIEANVDVAISLPTSPACLQLCERCHSRRIVLPA